MLHGVFPCKYKLNPFDGLAAIGIVVGVALDQTTKTLARSMCILQQPIGSTNEDAVLQLAHVGSQNTFAYKLSITHLPNGGVMLGALETSYPLMATVAFFAATAAGLAACVWLWGRQRASNCTTKQGILYLLAATSIAAGTVSNLLDRVRLGYVVDWIYIQFYVKNAHVSAPVFNLADTYIAAGIALGVAGFVLRSVRNRSLRLAGKRQDNPRDSARACNRSA